MKLKLALANQVKLMFGKVVEVGTPRGEKPASLRVPLLETQNSNYQSEKSSQHMSNIDMDEAQVDTQLEKIKLLNPDHQNIKEISFTL